MPVFGAGKTEEELEKRLGAAVIHGQSLVCIDNVVGELGGDALCRLIEQPRPSVRVLGQSLNVEIDARSTTYFCNGNNIAIVGDLCRRVIGSRLDPQDGAAGAAGVQGQTPKTWSWPTAANISPPA